jgi:hypothetical protein
MSFPKQIVLASAVVLAMLVAADSARANFFVCTPQAIAVFPKQRIHVSCATPAPGNVVYFAFSVKKKEAPLLVELFTAARTLGKNVGIYYDPNDLKGEKIGCLASDCRLFYGADIRP